MDIEFEVDTDIGNVMVNAEVTPDKYSHEFGEEETLDVKIKFVHLRRDDNKVSIITCISSDFYEKLVQDSIRLFSDENS